MRGMQKPGETAAGQEVGGEHRRRLPASRRRRIEDQRQSPQPQHQDRPGLPRSSSEPATKLTARWWDSDHLSASLPASFARKDDENSTGAGSLVSAQVANDDPKAPATRTRPQCGPRRGCYGQRYRYCAVTTLSAALVLGIVVLVGPGRGGGLSPSYAVAAASDPVTVERREGALDNPGIAAPSDLDADAGPDAQVLAEEDASGADNETDAQILEENTPSGADSERDALIVEEDTSNEIDSNALEGYTTNRHQLRRKRIFIDEKAKQKMMEERMKVDNILKRQHLMNEEDEVT